MTGSPFLPTFGLVDTLATLDRIRRRRSGTEAQRPGSDGAAVRCSGRAPGAAARKLQAKAAPQIDDRDCCVLHKQPLVQDRTGQTSAEKVFFPSTKPTLPRKNVARGCFSSKKPVCRKLTGSVSGSAHISAGTEFCGAPQVRRGQATSRGDPSS